MIDMLNGISKDLNVFVHASSNQQILKLNKTLQSRQDSLQQPNNLMKDFTQVIDAQTVTAFIDQVHQMIIQTDLISMTNQEKQERLTKEKNLLTLLGTIPGGEEYVKGILDGERWKTVKEPHSQGDQ